MGPVPIFIVAGEASGDLNGSALALSLKKLAPDLKLIGIGGKQMKEAGFAARDLNRPMSQLKAEMDELTETVGNLDDQMADQERTSNKVSRAFATLAAIAGAVGKQIYDVENNYLIVPKLFGEGGYWKTFDWNASSELGMKYIDLAYSGKHGFIETEMYWPINHMVVGGDQALACTSCHSKKETKKLDWIKLGYEGDPMKFGGRFK